MILTVQIKLLPTSEQAATLRKTLETANGAANKLSALALEKKEFRQFPMHRLFYRALRDTFPLSAQIVIRLIAKVADAYALHRNTQCQFRKCGSISYDSRILAINPIASLLSIWAINGRLKMPFICGERQRKLLEFPIGESDLILRKGKWFLNVSVSVPDKQEQAALGWLGIDLGLTNLARSSDGQTFGNAKHVAGLRKRRWRQRKRLQSKGTRSARRVLKRLRGRESRFVRDVNHQISKQIVAVAERTGRGIALEDLRYIRDRTRARCTKKQRRTLHSWSFADLQSKIEYKSRLIGAPVKFVDPANTSRKCPACGHVAKANRKTRDLFECVECGFTADADTNGAENIRLAAVNQPYEREGNRAQVRALSS